MGVFVRIGPVAQSGQTVGLLGGSFDPAHQGHVSITRAALTRFQLSQVWWMLTPHNPLKSHTPAPMGRRKAAALKVMRHPRVQITDVETQLKTTYTAQTLRGLIDAYPGVRFVWLMGADNLVQFHQWKDWQWIMETVPVGVLARPGDRISARMSKAATVYRQAQLPARHAAELATSAAPSWCFLNVPMSDASSTEIRNQGEWGSDT